MVKMQEEIDDLRIKLDIILGILQSEEYGTKTACQHTLYSWLNEWLNVYKMPDVKPKTLQCMHINVNKHIRPHIEDKRLNDVTTLDLKTVLGKIKYSRACRDVYGILNGAFRLACRMNMVNKNPMDGIRPPKYKRKLGQALTIKEQEEFLKLIKEHKHRDLFTFYILTGCRMSEALTVEWSDVDHENKMLHIKGTKTEMSDRKIPLFREVNELINSIRTGERRIFDVQHECLKSSFRRLKNRYKLPYSIKDLRHTFATRCYESGINLKTIQKWLGHSKLDTTANIYTHITDDFEKGEIKKYNPMLSAPKKRVKK